MCPKRCPQATSRSTIGKLLWLVLWSSQSEGFKHLLPNSELQLVIPISLVCLSLAAEGRVSWFRVNNSFRHLSDNKVYSFRNLVYRKRRLNVHLCRITVSLGIAFGGGGDLPSRSPEPLLHLYKTPPSPGLFLGFKSNIINLTDCRYHSRYQRPNRKRLKVR